MYTGNEAASDQARSDEVQQGTTTRQALALAACQPTVTAFSSSTSATSRICDRWQSGIFYADDTPKASMRIFHGAVESLRAGGLDGCGIADVDAFVQGTISRP